jgi:hypothetical protein
LNKYNDLSGSKEIAESSIKDKKLKWEAAKNGKYYLPVSINKISIQRKRESGY